METKILIPMVLAFIIITSGCISQNTPEPQTFTTTKKITVQRFITTTATTKITVPTTVTKETTKTVTVTTEHLVITTVTKTVTVTESFSSTTTSTPVTSPVVYYVKISYWGGNFTVDENGTTRTVKIPSEWYYLEPEISVLYEFLNPDYLEYFSSRVSQELGITTLPPAPIMEYYEPIASLFAYEFDYDYDRAVDPPTDSYLPHQLLTLRSGICGDYAIFYVALALAHGKTATLYVLSFSKDYGHALVEYNGVIWENNYIGRDKKYVLNYWLYESGPYVLYSLIVGPQGIINVGSTTISRYFSVPVTPLFMTSYVKATATHHFTWSIPITLVETLGYYGPNAYGYSTYYISTLINTIRFTYHNRTLEYWSSTYYTYYIITAEDDPEKFYPMPAYLPRYVAFYAVDDTYYLMYWNTLGEPMYYTVTKVGQTLYVTYTEVYAGTSITGTAVATLQ